MPAYKAPLHDIRFLMNEVLDYPAHYKTLSNGENADPDTVDMILEGAADYCENVLSPLNQSGDEEGCHFDNGEVTTPKGFKEAYDQFVMGGWQGLSYPEEFGGQGLPMSLNLIKSEMMGTANWSFTMYPGLSSGCMNTILQFGTDEQKQTYMPKLVEGTWSGTMCLTEPQCGTDLGQVKTKAEPQADGSYKITGTKIFISAGEHDLTENIIHIVLARLPDAPAGTRGISLFIVPKFMPTADGGVGERNTVACGSIEHKMGIRASATAVLNFDNATGYLIGEVNKGLHAMFTFMNTARIGTAVQGIAHAELSFQGALPYAKDRMSMRALSGKKDPDKVADAIIHHADVRRMLLTQKAIAEGGRSMIYYAAQIADKMTDALARGDQAAFEDYDDKLGFYTPILKGFLTELGLEAANHGMQVYGGHGYIKEWGMEQLVRDVRIAQIYEGTNGIQAADFMLRKVAADQGAVLVTLLNDIKAEITSTPLASTTTLINYVDELLQLTTSILAQDFRAQSANACDYLAAVSYVLYGYMWYKNLRALDSADVSDSFKHAKHSTAAYYFSRILPKAKGLFAVLSEDTAGIDSLSADHF